VEGEKLSEFIDSKDTLEESDNDYVSVDSIVMAAPNNIIL
jgi:hypothetical protein